MLTTTTIATTAAQAPSASVVVAAATATRKTTTLMTTRNMSSGSMKTSASGGNGVDTETETETATTTTTATKTNRTTKTTTTITSDPGILCFHHCNVKVFCFTLPHICPQCKTSLATQQPNGGASSAGATTTDDSGNQRKTKNKMKLNKNNKSHNKNNNNVKQNLSNDPNKDDNNANKDDGENDNNIRADAYAETDSIDDSDDDDDDNDLNKNCFPSTVMDSRLLPFRLPYPFVRANQYPCAIVLRPTTGDFLNDYNNTTDLHIAVTTSTGCVVEFDRHGLRRHRTDNMSDWWQCLLVGDVPEPWYDYWDQMLLQICQQPHKWTVSHYHEDKYNCYTFVLTFLQALTYDKLSEAASSKTRFCEKYIVPRTTTAGKYISLYRKLRDAGIYVHYTNHQKVGGYAKQKRHHPQQQQQQEQHQMQQLNPNKSNNLTTTATMSMAKNSLLTNKQQQKLKQQHLSNHHNHHSIISRPHSTLCTIEE